MAQWLSVRLEIEGVPGLRPTGGTELCPRARYFILA